VAIRGREIRKALRVFATTTTVAMTSITTAIATVTMPAITIVTRSAMSVTLVLLHIQLQEAARDVEAKHTRVT
jgi:hypothetical protein